VGNVFLQVAFSEQVGQEGGSEMGWGAAGARGPSVKLLASCCLDSGGGTTFVILHGLVCRFLRFGQRMDDGSHFLERSNTSSVTNRIIRIQFQSNVFGSLR
jgi:hypothetical protein